MFDDLWLSARHLARQGLLRLTDAQGWRIVCLRGRLWITQDGDRRDVVLDAGESFTLDRNGLALVSALADASLLLFDADARVSRPLAAPAAGARA